MMEEIRETRNTRLYEADLLNLVKKSICVLNTERYTEKGDRAHKIKQDENDVEQI